MGRMEMIRDFCAFLAENRGIGYGDYKGYIP